MCACMCLFDWFIHVMLQYGSFNTTAVHLVSWEKATELLYSKWQNGRKYILRVPILPFFIFSVLISFFFYWYRLKGCNIWGIVFTSIIILKGHFLFAAGLFMHLISDLAIFFIYKRKNGYSIFVKLDIMSYSQIN